METLIRLLLWEQSDLGLHCERSSLIWVCTVCTELSVRKLRIIMVLQINPDRTRCSGSTERMRVIGEVRSIPFFPDRPIFMFTVVYGIVYTMRRPVATYFKVVRRKSERRGAFHLSLMGEGSTRVSIPFS